MGVARRTRFFVGPCGKSEAYMALIVPPWQYPKRVNASVPEFLRTCGPGILQYALYRLGHIVQNVVFEG